MKHAHTKQQSWTDRTQPREFMPGEDTSISPSFPKQSFSHAHSSVGSLGVAGHIIHMAGVFAPVIAGELVQDATKYKKVVRLVSIGTAIAYEGLWTFKEHQRNKEREAKLAECHNRD